MDGAIRRVERVRNPPVTNFSYDLMVRSMLHAHAENRLPPGSSRGKSTIMSRESQMQKLPVGIDDFRKLREQNCLYVDKTRLVQEILDSSSEVLLLPRPRRFGKTLNQTMLQTFLEKTEENTGRFFEGLAIRDMPEYWEHQGRYPVIFLSFKDIKHAEFEECYKQIGKVLSQEYERHRETLEPTLDARELKYYHSIVTETADYVDRQNALFSLSKYLQRVRGRRVIILLDEYDTPIHAAFEHGYYDKAVNFIRGLLGMALKGNSHLDKAVLTGILRIARESIFSDLNNLDVSTILGLRFADKFGFTEEEVKSLLAERGLAEEFEGVRDWYDGYLFGGTTIYNPWSIIKYLNAPQEGLGAYWVNTSSNALIRQVITESDQPVIEAGLETLMRGESITSVINDNIVIRDVSGSAEIVWSFLLHCGYLKPMNKRMVDDQFEYDLSIPNREVKTFYRDTFRAWLENSTGSSMAAGLLAALVRGDVPDFARKLQEVVLQSFSYHDLQRSRAQEKLNVRLAAGADMDELADLLRKAQSRRPGSERVFHAFMLGLLVHLRGYRVQSNRESGFGRYDVLLTPQDISRPGYVLEFKEHLANEDTEEEPKALEASADDALNQIRQKDYAAQLRAAEVSRIMLIGVVIAGKKTFVKHEEA